MISAQWKQSGREGRTALTLTHDRQGSARNLIQNSAAIGWQQYIEYRMYGIEQFEQCVLVSQLAERRREGFSTAAGVTWRTTDGPERSKRLF